MGTSASSSAASSGHTDWGRREPEVWGLFLASTCHHTRDSVGDSGDRAAKCAAGRRQSRRRRVHRSLQAVVAFDAAATTNATSAAGQSSR